MNKTKIEWCDMTWNPVVGCLNSCPYCYARKIANRFGLDFAPMLGDPGMEGAGKCDSEQEGINSMLDLAKPYISHDGKKNSYPMAFAPTFHRYRLDEPQRIKKPQNIFVCSMADLFGDWIPDEWIQQVFEACEKAPWNRYLFLTKNPDRYGKLLRTNKLQKNKNFWYGITVTSGDDAFIRCSTLNFKDGFNWFLSYEPMLDGLNNVHFPRNIKWVIVGAETGNRKGKVIPKREWIENIANECRKQNVPVFLKNNLAEVWGKSLIQEFPWGENNKEGINGQHT